MKQRIRNGNIETTNNKASKTHHLFFNKHAIISDLPFRRKKNSTKTGTHRTKGSHLVNLPNNNWWKLQVIRGKITNITVTSPFTLGPMFFVVTGRRWLFQPEWHLGSKIIHQMSNRTHFSRSMPVAGKISELFPHYWWSLGWFIYEMTSLFGWGWL